LKKKKKKKKKKPQMNFNHLVTCPVCHFGRQFLLTTPCCGFSACQQCLAATAFCPSCRRIFDLKSCKSSISSSIAVAQELIECNWCRKAMDPILIQNHRENCPFRPPAPAEILDPEFISNSEAVQLIEINLEKEQKRFESVLLPVTDQPCFLYVIEQTDTLPGLALRFNVSQQAIRDLNNITGNLQERATIFIPSQPKQQKKKTAEERQRELQRIQNRVITSFIRQTNCKSRQEATFYLKDTFFDLDDAVRKFKEDQAWANQHPLSKPNPSAVPSHSKKGICRTAGSINGPSRSEKCHSYPPRTRKSCLSKILCSFAQD